MKIKFILPALEEAKSPYWRPIKYSLFPPLGIAVLASFCSVDDDVSLADEHVCHLDTDDSPDLVCIETYITNAYRAYEIADLYRRRGIHVAMGGLHATSLPDEAEFHADTILCGLGESIFPEFLCDFKRKAAKRRYVAGDVNFNAIPLPRRDLIHRTKYLVPNSMVFSRGCPNRCSFCYVSSFYKGQKSFYTYKIDRILEEMESLPGRHLYFLDDNLFADRKLCRELFREMRGMRRLFQGAVTVKGVLDDDTIELAREAGFRSAFIGFESTNFQNLIQANKHSNMNQDYAKAIRRLDELGIMINGSFIFGLDYDTRDVFRTTTQWAIDSGISTATFHILTPYPGTKTYDDMAAAGRIRCTDWCRYDTRHLVFDHPTLSTGEMEEGYADAYREFYTWRNIGNAAQEHIHLRMRCKHLLYAGAWKRFEPVWNFVIKAGLLGESRRMLEQLLR